MPALLFNAGIFELKQKSCRALLRLELLQFG